MPPDKGEQNLCLVSNHFSRHKNQVHLTWYLMNLPLLRNKLNNNDSLVYLIIKQSSKVFLSHTYILYRIYASNSVYQSSSASVHSILTTVMLVTLQSEQSI